MESKKKKPTVDYAAIIREYEMYGRGRSLKKFCDDSGYVYPNVLRYYRKCFWNSKAKVSTTSGEDSPFVPLEVENDSSESESSVSEEPSGKTPELSVPPLPANANPTYSIVSMHVSFSNGMELSLCETDVDEITALLHKIVGWLTIDSKNHQTASDNYIASLNQRITELTNTLQSTQLSETEAKWLARYRHRQQFKKSAEQKRLLKSGQQVSREEEKVSKE